MSDVKWGSDLSYLVYKRTYSRPVKDGSEEFSDTVDRILKACKSQLKLNFTPEEEAELAQCFYDMKGMVAGRFLWQLGTKTVDKLGLLSLQNCAAVVVNEPVRPFTWAMDALMLGCGVGFNIQREFVYELPKARKAKIVRKDTKDADFIVPDSREGWVQLLGKTLKAHFLGGKGFSYSTICIRGKGTPIKGFGGTSSGPEILCEGIAKISEVLNKRAGKKVRPVDCLDIMNIIASIVVAGNVRRCLPAGAQVHTDRGLVNIESVIPGKDKALTSEGYRLITNKFEQGVQDLIKIKTQDGSFECTSNHRMAVLNGVGKYIWKKAGQLQAGDRLISPRFITKGKLTQLPSWNYDRPERSTTCKNIVVPELDEDMAWLIGLFQADGYTYANRSKGGFNAYINIVVGLHEKDIANKAAAQLQRFGKDLHITIKKRKNENSIMVHCQSKQLAWYFDEHVKQTSTVLQVPEYIKQAVVSVRLAYVAGVADGDGSLSNRPAIVTSTIYGSWAKELQTVLYSCGIESRVKHQEKNWPSREGWQDISTLSLITKHSRESFANIPELHKELPIRSKTQNANGIPSEWIKDHTLKAKYGLRQAKQMNIDSYEKEMGFINLLPVEVIEVSWSRQGNTYDIEVEEMHEFFCDGYLTHNSAEISLGDYDDLQFLNAKDWSTGAIPNHRAMSNNSVICNDINELPEKFWEGYAGNGEPYGLINLKLSRSCGRLGDKHYQDPDIIGYNPCAEQSLANMETCCLAELYLPNLKTLDEAKRIATYLYRINKHSLRLKCHHSETEKIVHKHMRMGIGVTGYLQSTEEQKKMLPELYKHLREYDKEYSAKMGWPTSIKLTTVKPSGCSVGESLVFTEQGILRLDELVDTQGTEWQSINYTTTAGHQITKGFINGFVETRKLTTEDGFVFESSLNHKYLVNDGEWKQVKDITTNDRLRVDLGVYKNSQEVELKSIPESYVTNTKPILQPRTTNPDLSFFLGLLAADGSTHDKGIRISFNRRDNDLIVLLKDIAKEQFGLEGMIDKDHGFYLNSQQLLRWLEVNGFCKDYCSNITVPKAIRCSSVVSIKAYIQGFWRGDGGQHNQTNWSMCSVSQGFAQQIATLCRAVGYNVSIKNAGPGGYGKLDRWIISNKAAVSNRYQSKRLRSRFLEGGLWADPIVRVEESANHTYDVSVDHSDHMYLLGGAQSHNTLSLLAGVTPGVHPGYAQHYIRRVRMNAESPLVAQCREAGYLVEPQRNFDGTESRDTMVVSFPEKFPEGTVLAKDVSAIDQLEYVKRLQTDWSDNSVSCTVYYRKEELTLIKEWLIKYYNNNVKTVSFLLHSDHGFDQAPLEEITEEKYKEMIKGVNPITSTSFDESDMELSIECEQGSCPVK